MNVDELKKGIEKLFGNDSRIAGVVLFGSLVTGKFSEDSDIDLLFILEKEDLDLESIKIEIINRLEKEFPKYQGKFNVYLNTDFDEILFYPVEFLVINNPVKVADVLVLDPNRIKEVYEEEKESFKLREAILQKKKLQL